MRAGVAGRGQQRRSRRRDTRTHGSAPAKRAQQRHAELMMNRHVQARTSRSCTCRPSAATRATRRRRRAPAPARRRRARPSAHHAEQRVAERLVDRAGALIAAPSPRRRRRTSPPTTPTSVRCRACSHAACAGVRNASAAPAPIASASTRQMREHVGRLRRHAGEATASAAARWRRPRARRTAQPSARRDVAPHDERPHQVELLLDGERPEVRERRPRRARAAPPSSTGRSTARPGARAGRPGAPSPAARPRSATSSTA